MELLNLVVLEVIKIDFGVKGDIVIGGSKFVIVEIGVEIMVFLFIFKGEWIKIDICNDFYLGRE